MTDITIPPEAVEAAARHIAEGRLPEFTWAELDDDMKEFYREDALPAIRAAIIAWPGMKTPTEQWARDNGRNIAPCIILPLPQENSNG